MAESKRIEWATFSEDLEVIRANIAKPQPDCSVPEGLDIRIEFPSPDMLVAAASERLRAKLQREFPKLVHATLDEANQFREIRELVCGLSSDVSGEMMRVRDAWENWTEDGIEHNAELEEIDVNIFYVKRRAGLADPSLDCDGWTMTSMQKRIVDVLKDWGPQTGEQIVRRLNLDKSSLYKTAEGRQKSHMAELLERNIVTKIPRRGYVLTQTQADEVSSWLI